MVTVAKVVVGSRLHHTNTPESDWDYRGIYMDNLEDGAGCAAIEYGEMYP